MIINLQNIRKKVKQSLCRHNFKHIAYNKHSSMHLWQCTKCKIYSIQHPRTGLSCMQSSVKEQQDNWYTINPETKLE